MKYKVIVRDPDSGLENYIDELSRETSIEEAAKQAADESKQIYVEWTDSKGSSGYLNRDGGTDCPGEPW